MKFLFVVLFSCPFLFVCSSFSSDKIASDVFGAYIQDPADCQLGTDLKRELIIKYFERSNSIEATFTEENQSVKLLFEDINHGSKGKTDYWGEDYLKENILTKTEFLSASKRYGWLKLKLKWKGTNQFILSGSKLIYIQSQTFYDGRAKSWSNSCTFWKKM